MIDSNQQTHDAAPGTAGPSPKARFIRRMFDTIAPDYDRLNSWVSLGMDRFWRRNAIKRMPAEGLIVDWCAGSGDMSKEYLRRKGNQGRVVLCDFSAEMRRIYDSRLTAEERRRCFYVCCDVTKTPFRDGVFDGQMQGFAIRNLMNRPSFFAEVKRVGRQGHRGALLDLSVPRFPLWRWVCNFYFHVIAPRLVAILTKRGVFAYRYLAESIEHHMDPRDIVKEIQTAGIPDAEYVSLAGGIGAIFVWGGAER